MIKRFDAVKHHQRGRAAARKAGGQPSRIAVKHHDIELTAARPQPRSDRDWINKRRPPSAESCGGRKIRGPDYRDRMPEFLECGSERLITDVNSGLLIFWRLNDDCKSLRLFTHPRGPGWLGRRYA